MGQLIRQAAVEAKGFQLQPDEAETVVVKQDEQTRCALRACEAVAGYQAGSIKTEMYKPGYLFFIF